MSQMFAPWSPEQVKNLNDFQTEGHMHPFTCGSPDCRADLVATANGWTCPSGCGYTQNWAHDFMVDGSWRKGANEIANLLARARKT